MVKTSKKTLKTKYLDFESKQKVVSGKLAGKLDRNTHKHKQNCCTELLKPINHIYEIQWLKSTVAFNEQSKILLKLTVEIFCCGQKTIKFEQLLQILVPAVMKLTKPAKFRRTAKSIHSWTSQIWYPLDND